MDSSLSYWEGKYFNLFSSSQKLSFVNLYIFQVHNHHQQAHLALCYDYLDFPQFCDTLPANNLLNVK